MRLWRKIASQQEFPAVPDKLRYRFPPPSTGLVFVRPKLVELYFTSREEWRHATQSVVHRFLSLPGQVSSLTDELVFFLLLFLFFARPGPAISGSSARGRYTPHRRGRWWNRLSLDLAHTRRHRSALWASREGLRDPRVLGGDRLALEKRTRMLSARYDGPQQLMPPP